MLGDWLTLLLIEGSLTVGVFYFDWLTKLLIEVLMSCFFLTVDWMTLPLIEVNSANGDISIFLLTLLLVEGGLLSLFLLVGRPLPRAGGGSVVGISVGTGAVSSAGL